MKLNARSDEECKLEQIGHGFKPIYKNTAGWNYNRSCNTMPTFLTRVCVIISLLVIGGIWIMVFNATFNNI